MLWSIKLIFVINFLLVNQIGYAEVATNLCWKIKCQYRHKKINVILSWIWRVWKPMSNWTDVNFTNHTIYVHCCENRRCTTWSERLMCFRANRFEESSDCFTKNVYWRIFDFSCFKTLIARQEATNLPSFC